jgi:PAS domain S-box-containing protein
MFREKVENKNSEEVDIKTLQLLPAAVMLYDSKGIYFANKRACEILSIKENEANSGKLKVFDFLQKKYHSEIKKYISQALSGGVVEKRELELLDNKRKNLLIESESNPVYWKGRTVLQCVFSEISAHRSLVNASKSAIDLLRKISANSHDVIFHFGFEKRMQLKFISDSAQQTLGFSPNEIYKDPTILREHLHKDDRHLLVTSKSDYLLQNVSQRKRKIIVWFKHKNGDYRHLEIAVNPVYGQKRELVGLIGNMRDITDRIETGNLLLETKKKFDLITNNSNDLICFYTYLPEEKYLYVSPNIKKILGYKEEDLMNDASFMNKRLLGENEGYFEGERLMRTYQQKNIKKNLHFSFKLSNSKGEEVWMENNLVPITDKHGKITFFINIIRDITEQKESDIAIETQYYNYRNLLDNSPVAYVIHDHGVCLYVNNALAKLLKVKNKNSLLGKFTLDFFEEPDRKRALQRIKEVYENPTKKTRFFNYVARDNEGGLVELEIKSVAIKFNNRDCILSLVNSLEERREREKEKVKVLITETANKQLQKEIRERQEAERNLTEKTAHLSSIFESSTHLVWTVNGKYEVTSYNQNFAEVVKIQHGISIKPGYKIDEYLIRNQKAYVDFWYSKYAEAFKGKKLEFVKEDNDERPLYRKIFINPIYNERGEVAEISCIANDITDSKIYEQKLIQQTGKLSAIFDSSHHYIWTIDRFGKLTSFNKNYYELVTTLYNTKPFLGLELNRGVLANDREYTELLQHHYVKAFAGQATSFEIETRDKDLKNVYLEIFLNPIIENGLVVEVSGIAHNTTEKKHVQQKMEQSLKEKEVLLREVHHRVKNNMQVISSILNLQSSYVSDEYTLSLLKESQNRIKTMAYIHESLYQNKSFTSVNFSEYVHTLVNNIVQSYAYNSEKIKLALNIEKVTLSLDSSIPAGLIINEIITNAIKHAFPGTRQGLITFTLRTENNFVFLELKDDGVGFAPGVDFENSHSLGLQLVNTLIEQIEAELKFKTEADKGTEVFVTFKM